MTNFDPFDLRESNTPKDYSKYVQAFTQDIGFIDNPHKLIILEEAETVDEDFEAYHF